MGEGEPEGQEVTQRQFLRVNARPWKAGLGVARSLRFRLGWPLQPLIKDPWGFVDHVSHCRRTTSQGRKVFTLQRLPACDEPFDDVVGKVAGFSLDAGVAARADERQKLERRCRYISRPTVAEKCLSLTANGNLRYQLKTPYRDGTRHFIFEPLDFIARPAAPVPKPRVNPGSSPGQALTPLHAVFAPNSKHRARVTPAKRGGGGRHDTREEPTPAERRASMSLKRSETN